MMTRLTQFITIYVNSETFWFYKNCLSKAVLWTCHNICFFGRMSRKFIKINAKSDLYLKLCTVFTTIAGLLYDHGHLSRAVCCRVGRGETDIDSLLPEGYRLNHPWLGRVTACEPQREVQVYLSNCNISQVWKLLL